MGLETSLQFAAEGARVLLSDVNIAALSKAVELVRSNFPTSQAVGMTCDVSKEADVQALVDAALAHWDRLDVMVGVVASVRSTATDLPSSTMRGLCIQRECLPASGCEALAHSTSDSGAIDTEEKIWDLTQAINVKGVWFGCKHAILAMRKVSPRDSPLFLS